MKAHVKLLSLIITLSAFFSCQKEYSLERGTQSVGSLQKDPAGDCLPKTINGTFVSGQVLNPDADYIDIQVDVTTAGTYQISTNEVNGIKFSASGNFADTGLNTVRLKGSGTPAAEGPANFTVTYSGSSCDVEIIVLPVGGGSTATFTLAGAPSACTDFVLAGAYVTGAVLNSPANSVSVKVNVTNIGTYNITTTPVNGISFTGSGTFANTGETTVVLTASGTPVTAGNFPIAVTVGGSTCTFPISVTGATDFTFNCGTAVLNGVYTQGVPLDASNNITVEINAAAAGAYTITLTGNGMTFSGSGNAVAGPQTITLNGSGTPVADGDFTIPLTNGTPACDINLTVVPGTTPSDMVWEFKQGATTYSGTSTGGVILSTGGNEGMGFNGPSTNGNFSFVFTIQKTGVLTTGDYTTQSMSSSVLISLLNISTAETLYTASFGTGVLTLKITTLDRTNNIVQGTFSGTAKNAAGSLVPVSGSFKGPIL